MRTIDTSLIRLLAILLITNSHLDSLYPDARLATGGGLGNALFFAMSGFGLGVSFHRSIRSFSGWMGRRIIRIYPQLILVAAIGIGTGMRPMPGSVFEWAGAFGWPTHYWFISAIVLFYVPVYLLLRHRRQWIGPAAILMCIPYAVWYVGWLDLHHFAIEGPYFRWIFYFATMLCGAWFSAHVALLEGGGWRDAGAAGAALGGYFGLKVLMATGLAGRWQFLLHVLTLVFVFFSVRFCAGQRVVQWLRAHWLGDGVRRLGQLSLEAYLVQGMLVEVLHEQRLPPAVSLALVWPLVFAAAWLVRSVTAAALSVLRTGSTARAGA